MSNGEGGRFANRPYVGGGGIRGEGMGPRLREDTEREGGGRGERDKREGVLV